jgi:hypothetical protein
MKKKKTDLKDFLATAKKNRGGQRSPLDDNLPARNDAIAFGVCKFAGETSASWVDFAAWMKATHGIDMRANSLYMWCKNRSR